MNDSIPGINFKIGDRKVGDGCPVFIVMEVAQAHDGSLGVAHAFIDVAAEAGVDAVKFQTHIAEAESTKREKFRVQFSYQDSTRFAYWKRMEFTEDQWVTLADHARKSGLIFLSSPFSLEAIELLDRIGVPAWKVGSGEVGNTLLLDEMIKTGKPILLSSGMSSWEELDQAIETIKTADVPLMVYQCTSRYPCKPEDVGLGLIKIIQDRYRIPVGLSDHSGTIYPGIAAAALGAASVEVHITLSRYAFGPDVSASLTPEELKQMVEGIRMVETSLRSTHDKSELASQMRDMKKIFSRSVVTRVPIARGTVLSLENLTLKKPGGGIPPSGLARLVGRKVKRDLNMNTFISIEDLEDG
jgi:N-acetylneuraminate synthase